MVRTLSLFLTLLAGSSQAAFLPAPPVILACGVTVPIPAGKTHADLIHLGCNVGTATRFCTLRNQNGSGGSGYTVTSGKTLHIFTACFSPGSTGTFGSFLLGYGDTDVGMDSSSAPTNPVYNFAHQTTASYMMGVGSSPGPSPVNSFDFQVPATKRPLGEVYGTAGFLLAWGYETTN